MGERGWYCGEVSRGFRTKSKADMIKHPGSSEKTLVT